MLRFCDVLREYFQVCWFRVAWRRLRGAPNSQVAGTARARVSVELALFVNIYQLVALRFRLHNAKDYCYSILKRFVNTH